VSAKPYVKNPKLKTNSNYSGEDLEDFEQEKAIREWLEREGRAAEFEYTSINRKGTARNSFNSRTVSLDKKVHEDGSRTLADLVAGSDGRDLAGGRFLDEVEPKSAAERLEESIDLFFDAIGASEGTKSWAKKSLKSAESLRTLRSLMKEEKQFEISPINLESPRPWGNFRK
jgi:hypothetical protein